MSRTKITFLNPPFLKNYSRPQRSPAVTKSGTLYFPLWLCSAAALAEAKGHEIDVIDAPADDHDLDYVLQRIDKLGPGLIVVDTSTPSIYNDADICKTLKEKVPGVLILMVGTHVSALPEESLVLSDAIDAIAVGEYDETVLDVARVAAGEMSLSEVAGLCCRVDGKPQRTAKRGPIEDLDTLPFVSGIYKKFLRIENYFNPNSLHPMVTITTSRGCPHHCFFCVYPQTMMGHKMRVRSVKDVVDEIESIIQNFPGVKSIFFEDDTFTIHRERCADISREIIRRGIRISWTANARADLDYETMKVMQESGCRCVCVGFETGNQHLLDRINKAMSLEKYQPFVESARKAGILVHGCFMVGLPGETRETMANTLDLAKRLTPETVQFYPVMIYPGTEAFKWAEEKGLIATRDFSKWLTPQGLHNTIIRGEGLSSEDLVRFCDDARREFYLRPRYILYKLWQMIRHPSEIKRNLKSARTFAKYLLKGSDIKKAEDC
ncbi:MAG: radical SAM protein [Magnetococcales bacterium]|nr:radical SAM protein [Magnetococcales bacterium]